MGFSVRQHDTENNICVNNINALYVDFYIFLLLPLYLALRILWVAILCSQAPDKNLV